MEYLIFSIFGLMWFAIFLIFTILPFFIAERIGFFTGYSSLRWGLPTVLFFLIVVWGFASYLTFRHDCQIKPKTEIFTFLVTPAAGFTLHNEIGYLGNFYWEPMLETGAFHFIDMSDRRRCIGAKEYVQSSYFPITMQCAQYSSMKSKYVVHLFPMQKIHYWWSPPIFISEIRIEEVSSGRVLAKASELIFGGGLVGRYLSILGGDQDFKYISCGYTDTDIGAWRPTLVNSPRFAEYEAADLLLVTKVLGAQQ